LQKTPGGKKMYNFKLLHGKKYAENCRSEALKLQTSQKTTIVEFWSDISSTSCGIAMCFLQVAEL
jgi:hypothetical protein